MTGSAKRFAGSSRPRILNEERHGWMDLTAGLAFVLEPRRFGVLAGLAFHLVPESVGIVRIIVGLGFFGVYIRLRHLAKSYRRGTALYNPVYGKTWISWTRSDGLSDGPQPS